MEATRELTQAMIALFIALLVAWAGSQHGATALGLPVMVLCTLLAFAVQWAVFVHAWRKRTEQYFDLTGSVTYMAVLTLALILGNGDSRSLLIAVLVAIWAIRLGTFLFQRVRSAGLDRRFDRIKSRFSAFFMTWTLQGLWVSLTLAAALAAMTSVEPQPLDLFALLGTLVWGVGFSIEALADHQKHRFRANPGNQGQFISGGLWAWSRHPNYFGEILLWIGVAVIAAPVLQGWQWVTLISPLFVYVLLTRISGIGMLERRAAKIWGEDPEYQAYKARTPVLVLRPPG